jgi:hypothetical protein
MDLQTDYGTDNKKEIEGVWFKEEFGGETECLIARIGNPEYQKVFNRISKPQRRALRKGTIQDEIAETILIRTMAKTILLDWKNMKENGKVLKYSHDEAFRVLKKYRDFRDIVSDLANEIEAYRVEDEEEIVKN